MRKSNVALRLQTSLLEEAKRVAQSEGVALNQLINVAVAEKLSALRTEDYFAERATRASLKCVLVHRRYAGHASYFAAPQRTPLAITVWCVTPYPCRPAQPRAEDASSSLPQFRNTSAISASPYIFRARTSNPSVDGTPRRII